MSTEVYLNSPVRCCATCFYRQVDGNLPTWPKFDYCLRWHTYADIAVRHRCGDDLIEWRPKPPAPPRRSLRQWLYDTFWA